MSMPVSEIKRSLDNHIQHLQNLSDSLAKTGLPLKPLEKELLREALSAGWLKQIHMEMRYLFIAGDADEMKSVFEISRSLLETLQ